MFQFIILLAEILSTWEKDFLCRINLDLSRLEKKNSFMDKSFNPMEKIENATFFCFIHKGKIFSK
jgi:hypothetical protein